MGRNIGTYPQNIDVQTDDFLLGSDGGTIATGSFSVQSLIDLISVSGTSIVGINVQTIIETETQNFIQVINADTSGNITFNSGDVGIFDVFNWKGTWKASYILIKNATASITYGNSWNQLALEELVPIRIADELSEPTSGVNGGGVGSNSLVLSNDGDNYSIAFKGLVDGEKSQVVADGNNLKIDFTGEVGESNTLENAENTEGNVLLAGTKAGEVLKVKSLKVTGATVTDHTEYVEIDVSGKLSASASFTLDTTHKGKEIWMKNAASVEVTIPSGLPTDFDCAFIQKGAGQVKFIPGPGSTILFGKNTMSGQGASVLVTNDPDASAEIALLGDLIIT